MRFRLAVAGLLFFFFALLAPVAVSAHSVADSNTLTEIRAADDYTRGDADTLRLYRAFLNRDPDVDGSKYWIQQSRTGASPDDLAYGFAQSAEFKARYGALTNGQFLAVLYDNMLGRQPDAEGFDYWLDQMNFGGLPQHGVVRWIVANDEFVDRFPFNPIPKPTFDAFVVQELQCDDEPNLIDMIECDGRFRNASADYAQIVARVEFLDATGLRVDSEARFTRLVAPDEVFEVTFFGPATTVTGRTLEFSWESDQPHRTGAPLERHGGQILPLDTSVISVGQVVPNLIGGTNAEIRIRNVGSVRGDITALVAFYDAGGVRLETDGRRQVLVPVNTEYLQDAFGPPGAVRAEVVEVQVDPA